MGVYLFKLVEKKTENMSCSQHEDLAMLMRKEVWMQVNYLIICDVNI